MILLKMNVRNKEILNIDVNNTNVFILFGYSNNNYQTTLEIKKNQIKQIYNKIRNQEKKNKKLKQKWINKR